MVYISPFYLFRIQIKLYVKFVFEVNFQVLRFVFLVLKSKSCLTGNEDMEWIYAEQDNVADKRSSVKETGASKVDT